jgi:hypothetical protein
MKRKEKEDGIQKLLKKYKVILVKESYLIEPLLAEPLVLCSSYAQVPLHVIPKAMQFSRHALSYQN